MSARTTVVLGARVHTMDPVSGLAEAFGVADGVFTVVGSRVDVLRWAPADAEVIDLGGAAVLPGLLDTHVHHNMAGEAELRELRVAPTDPVDAIIAAVAERVANTEDEWVVGGNWGSTLFQELSRSEPLARLDAVSGDRPVLLADDSHHNRWANTAALRATGVLDLLEDPQGGCVVRDADGRPTGLLVEAAGASAERARQRLVSRSPVQTAEASATAIRQLNAWGITTFQDAAVDEPVMAGLALLDREQRLTARVVSSLLVNDPIFGVAKVGTPLLAAREQYRTTHHLPSFVKIFLDGVPTSFTAAFLEPYAYSDAHGGHHHGSTLFDPEQLDDVFEDVAVAGLGIKVHCTGDASVRVTLDATARLRSNGHTDTIVQVAHTAFVHDDDLPRFAELGVVAEVSPFLWAPGVIPTEVLRCIPPGLSGAMHPHRSLLDAGAQLAAGSDWPVADTANPWWGIHGLVTRTDPAGVFPGALVAGQAISLHEAVEAFTVTAAAAMGLGDVAGRIAPGLSADFVVLDRDPFEIAPADLRHVTAAQTWFAGGRVHAVGPPGPHDH